MKLSQDMQLIQKLRDDQKRIKKAFEVMSGIYVTTKKAQDRPREKRLEDVPIVQDFPEDLQGNSIPPTPTRRLLIDWLRAPYRLALYEMKELSDQRQEVSDKDFIRPSSSPWGDPVLFVKKKDGSFRMRIVDPT
ncbi:hypothetical protein Tco_1082645 [Tanacetum coccineum]|uniref:Reverse transcriptase n=1 Tax=Tanacetum coccineum TaxID=301880 RepID=A0ABQ5I1B0_9ASTR